MKHFYPEKENNILKDYLYILILPVYELNLIFTF